MDNSFSLNFGDIHHVKTESIKMKKISQVNNNINNIINLLMKLGIFTLLKHFWRGFKWSHFRIWCT